MREKVLQGKKNENKKKKNVEKRQKDPLKTFYREKKRKLENENKGQEEINIRSSSKNVKKEPQENVYQGSKKNENMGLEVINMRSLSKNVKKDPH